jgi:phosphatidyl-myo-inositol alpha-mannosyltransferase
VRQEREIDSSVVKVGIVVPFSWSFWGAVNEHAELQAEALRRLGIETRTIIGNDPPGSFTRVLHPRLGRHDEPPTGVIPVGRTVIVPANGSLSNVVVSAGTLRKVRRALGRERFDVLHVHEPMTPAVCVAAIALAQCPVVATWHAAGPLRWNGHAVHLWGFLIDRVDYRIAVSEQARRSAERFFPGPFDVIPNGVLIPPRADPGGRVQRVVFAGRHDPRKGLPVLLQAWPEIHRRTGARLRLAGADPLAVRLVLARQRGSDDGIDVLGLLPQERLTEELLSAKVLVAPSVGMESFGMVLARAFACALPVVASDIPGYRDLMTPETGLLVPPGDVRALAEAVVRLLEDEPRRRSAGAVARRVAETRYSWDPIAQRLLDIYGLVLDGRPTVPATLEAATA